MEKEKHGADPPKLETPVPWPSIDPSEYTYWSEAELDDTVQSPTLENPPSRNSKKPSSNMISSRTLKPSRVAVKGKKREVPGLRRGPKSQKQHGRRPAGPSRKSPGPSGHWSQYSHERLVSLVRDANLLSSTGIRLQQLSHQDLVDLLEKPIPNRAGRVQNKARKSLSRCTAKEQQPNQHPVGGEELTLVTDTFMSEASTLVEEAPQKTPALRTQNDRFIGARAGQKSERAADNSGPDEGTIKTETTPAQRRPPKDERRARPSYNIKTLTYGPLSARVVGKKSLMAYLKKTFPSCVDLETNAFLRKLATQPMVREPKVRKQFRMTEYAEAVSTSRIVTVFAIQASGQLARKTCSCCRRGEGPFKDCVIIPFSLFSTRADRREHWHCANCHTIKNGKGRCSIKGWSWPPSQAVLQEDQEDEGVEHTPGDIVEDQTSSTGVRSVDASPAPESCSGLLSTAATVPTVEDGEIREGDDESDFPHDWANDEPWAVAPGYFRSRLNGKSETSLVQVVVCRVLYC